jgi:hypothetical protein
VDAFDDLVTQHVYARIRDCSQRTVERERQNGSGCRFVKIDRSVRYRKRDILEFIERHLCNSTSESAGPLVTAIAERLARPPNCQEEDDGSAGIEVTPAATPALVAAETTSIDSS